MKNLIYYMKVFGNRSFDEFPFNEVDSMILCQLTYLNYDNLAPTIDEGEESIYYSSLIQDDLSIIKMSKNTFDPRMNRKLLKLIRKKTRFQHMKINYYQRKFSSKFTKQFCAISYIFDRFIHITYQGTDVSLVGWKEDFMMSFLEKIPAQEEAVNYLNHVSMLYHGPIFVGGHSKGGNLAYYASLNCKEIARERIMRVFNFDGPGFLSKDYLYSEAYKELKCRMSKIVPKDSVVGLLMNHNDRHLVVECYGYHFVQHNLYTWKVNNIGHLKFLKGGSLKYKVFEKASQQWIDSYSQEERMKFTNQIFDILGSMGNASVLDAVFHPFSFWKAVYKRYKKLSKEERESLKSVIVSYAKISRKIKKEFKIRRRRLIKINKLKSH